MFMLIVTFGLYFGMVVLPVMLSLIGPASHSSMGHKLPSDLEVK